MTLGRLPRLGRLGTGADRRRLGAAAFVVLLLGGLPGCADDESSAAPDGGAATSATSSSPSTPPGSETPTGNSDASPAVEPAAGPLLEREVVSLHAPTGWELVEASFSNQVQAKPRKSGIDTDMLLSSIPGSSTADLDDLERAALESVTEPERTRKQPRVEVGGVEMNHIVTPSLFGRQDLFVTL